MVPGEAPRWQGATTGEKQRHAAEEQTRSEALEGNSVNYT